MLRGVVREEPTRDSEGSVDAADAAECLAISVGVYATCFGPGSSRATAPRGIHRPGSRGQT
jgi:hypothetical protein